MNDAASVPFARLTHRGESWEMGDGPRHYTGECVWSWVNGPDGSPRPAHPLYVSQESVRCRENGVEVALDCAGRRAAAETMKRLMEAREPGCHIEIVP